MGWPDTFDPLIRARRRSGRPVIQYWRKRGLWAFVFFSFFLVLYSLCLHMLQRVSLQTWQKLQSGQGFFLRRIIFPMFYSNLKNAFKEKVAQMCGLPGLKLTTGPEIL